MNEKVQCSECKHFNAETKFCKLREGVVSPRFGCNEGDATHFTRFEVFRKNAEQMARAMVFMTTSVDSKLVFTFPGQVDCWMTREEAVEAAKKWLMEEFQ